MAGRHIGGMFDYITLGVLLVGNGPELPPPQATHAQSDYTRLQTDREGGGGFWRQQHVH